MENKKLDEFNDYIKYRKIAVIGLGVSNIPLLDYLHEKKAKVTVFDQRTIAPLSSSFLSSLVVGKQLGDLNIKSKPFNFSK